MIRKKLFLICAVVLTIVLGISACKDGNKKEADGPAVADPASKTYPAEISRGSNYLITRESSFVFRYQIFNSEGEIVRERIFEGKEPQISVLEDGSLDISVGFGTGLIVHTYYDVERDLFSNEFSYVVASSDGRIAYIYIPEGGGFENRRLIIRDIFDVAEFCKEFTLDLAHTDHPIVEAEFLDDGERLRVSYLTEDDHSEKTQILDLAEVG